MNAKRITALALALVMTLLLAACGSKTVVNDDGTKTEQTERGVKVTQTAAKAVQTEKYETADFSMTIPKGWTVTTGGTNIYHSIRVSDPNEPLTAAAVTRVATGACPAAAASPMASKSAAARAGERRYRSMQDIDGAH